MPGQRRLMCHRTKCMLHGPTDQTPHHQYKHTKPGAQSQAYSHITNARTGIDPRRGTDHPSHPPTHPAFPHPHTGIDPWRRSAHATPSATIPLPSPHALGLIPGGFPHHQRNRALSPSPMPHPPSPIPYPSSPSASAARCSSPEPRRTLWPPWRLRRPWALRRRPSRHPLLPFRLMTARLSLSPEARGTLGGMNWSIPHHCPGLTSYHHPGHMNPAYRTPPTGVLLQS